ncbi:RagB/SusD family nutrient uptake outer membrane protein [Reichenbachiella ulvae]|uniref:RagB/SusD family nutrient uptake outer membrane protein n=1 Tax=Reichenbachiella ulvae TaxID=2980104 RepID=A0ABT3CTJ3_9BACT|nr:RagB/SusD family nutrient uptake outer membrane protein [Reichenbachiella ulvae]MCV9387012.1 RagB/SusD family nutrient uptake outer membrane protein [Reichenbachiella ulvae]
MKNNNIIFIILLSLLGLSVGCTEDFLDRPPKDTLVDANFYNSDEQVLAGTAVLYNAAWKTYVDQSNFQLGDIRGGSVYRAWGNRDAVTFNITPVSASNEQAYRSFFVTIGQSNLAINNINAFAGAEVSENVKQHAIAEARFMRAVAYMHLVMNYGAVPIIENNLDHLDNPQLRRNTVESVWEFIQKDFEFAAAHLSVESLAPGRLTKWSALGMLARTHLTLAGLGATPGNRDQSHLDDAMAYADSVITMSGKSLMSKYEDLFLYPYDNNNESLFELQWVFSLAPNGYDASNTMVSQITYSNSIAANGDGWGGDLSASWWMLSLYDGLIRDNGATPGFSNDERLKATFMLPGFTYPEIVQTVTDENGVSTEQDLVFEDPGDVDFSYASIKKYVVGKADGNADRQRYPNNTYMMRLAEMYLIYAEAALGNNASTADAKALEYFNAVHKRAGLGEFPPQTNPTAELTWQMIFEERIKEFAMESMAWYDLVRLHYYNPNEAYNIINNQYRGLFVVKPNQWPDPTAWTFEQTSWSEFSYPSANSGNFLLPIPASEASQAPSLGLDPIPYEFEGGSE